VLANATFGYAQGASPLASTGVPQTATSPSALPPSSAAAPTPLGNKLPLGIANTSSKAVDVYIEGGLKCRLPAKYKCQLEVPPGRYAIRFVRSDGSTFSDSFALPQVINGTQYNGGAFLVMDDRIEFGAPKTKR
jgi:hypothetical protein